jgi:hypothetical protein
VSRYYVPSALLITLAVVACNKANVEEQSIRLAAKLAALADSSRPRQSNDPKPHSDSIPVFVVDASRSMAGFVGCNGNATEYDVTLDRLTTDLSIVAITRFGERTVGGGRIFEDQPLTRAVHCGPFYDRLQNPDYSLYKRIREDSAGRTFLYITDGVQSDLGGSSPSPSVAELKRWVQERKALAILGFRSQFAGQAWSEQRRQMLGSVRVENRPFYAFLFAPNTVALDRLLARLSQSTLATAVPFRFDQDAVRCSASPARRLPKYTWRETPPWTMVRLTSQRSVESPLLDFRCELQVGYPVGVVLPRISTEYRQWRGSGFSTEAAASIRARFSADSVETKRNESIVHVNGTLPFDNLTRFGFYSIRLTPEPGELRGDVNALSTDSDASTDSFTRTYRFSWLVEQLARVHLATAAWSPYALTIQYR